MLGPEFPPRLEELLNAHPTSAHAQVLHLRAERVAQPAPVVLHAAEKLKVKFVLPGHGVPAGLKESDAFPEPIFTPSTKATTGHDENISFDQMCEIVGVENASHLRDLTLRVYKKAAAYARQRGIIGGGIYDSLHATFARRKSANRIITRNLSHFSHPAPELEVLAP